MTPALDPQIVRALTEEDAVERLAAVLDTAPPETDVLARYHWIQENAQLVQQLEAHILHVQKNPPEEKPKMTHQETLTAMVREIESLVTRAGNALDRASYLDLYQKQNNLRNKAKSFASKHDLEEPVFPAQPVNPFAKKKTPQPAVKIDVHPQPVAPLQESVVEREPEARPYQEPTPQDIAAMLNRPLAFADIDLQDRQLHVRVDLSSMLDGPRSEPPAWVQEVLEEVARARSKFPDAHHRTLALVEESGEVVKAMLDLHNGKPGATLEHVHKEIIQTMAMCVRLLEEGDQDVLGATA